MDLPSGLVGRALDAMPTQVAVLDDEGVIVWTNRAWADFGVDNDIAGDPNSIGDDYLGVCAVAAEGDEHAAQASSGLQAILDGDREQFSLEYPCHSPEKRRWFTMRAVPFEHDGDRYVLVAHLDITERKLAELRVGEKNEQLEGVASMLSHDLRNPLSVAMGHLELLEGDGQETAAIADALERMETIIEDALILARTDEPDDLQAVALEAAARDGWTHVETREATLQIDGELTFEADPSLLAHVFENLFRNAVEHGGDAVTVTVGATDDGFFVADDGPGIPSDDRETVFTSGYTTSGDGSGLGLAIVRRVCEAHGWEVGVGESEEGGARFEVTGVERVS